MRRKDREVTDFEEIVQIIEGCEVVRIGLFDPDDPEFPYIVPVNFGYTVSADRQIDLYIHGARAGRKFELMQRVGHCSFEMECDAFVDIIEQDGDVTMRYKSVMGKAEITLLEGADVEPALQSLMNRREDTRAFVWNRAPMPRTAVWRLRVTQLSAKANRGKA